MAEAKERATGDRGLGIRPEESKDAGENGERDKPQQGVGDELVGGREGNIMRWWGLAQTAQ